MKPFISIMIDECSGEARVVFHKRFRLQSWLWQADVLQDVLRQSLERYEACVGKWEHELDTGARADIREQLEEVES